jgi:shikimate dehydrogenase
MKRIVLTGFRGTGKTDTGRILAHNAGVPFIDTDALIELTTGRSIPTIFEEDGEARFRDIERGIISSLPKTDTVIGTGGGVVLDPVNMEQLRRDSTVILLFASLATIEQRLKRSPRPPLTDLPLAEEITQLMDTRRPAYYASADFCIDTSDTTPAMAAEKIRRLLSTGTVTPGERSAGLAFFRSGRIIPPAMQRLEEILGPGNPDPLTRIMGVAGYPAAHSRGPYLFNALFARYGLNYHYTWFEHPDIGGIMKTARGLDVKGLSVTIPFKQDVIGFLDDVDEHGARQIGAVNTVVFACGEAIGYNTDWIGVRKPLVSLKGSKAVLLGAGGGASAAAYALVDLDMDLTILNRTPEKAQALAEKFGCHWKAWDEFDSIQPDLVVNATPLGMQPDTRSPLREEQLTKEMTIFDLVYTPPETPLLETARMKGCTVIQGTEMFIEQAREQFYRFFGIDVPSAVVKENLS